jgi:hypothetical protein
MVDVIVGRLTGRAPHVKFIDAARQSTKANTSLSFNRAWQNLPESKACSPAQPWLSVGHASWNEDSKTSAGSLRLGQSQAQNAGGGRWCHGQAERRRLSGESAYEDKWYNGNSTWKSISHEFTQEARWYDGQPVRGRGKFLDKIQTNSSSPDKQPSASSSNKPDVSDTSFGKTIHGVSTQIRVPGQLTFRAADKAYLKPNQRSELSRRLRIGELLPPGPGDVKGEPYLIMIAFRSDSSVIPARLFFS